MLTKAKTKKKRKKKLAFFGIEDTPANLLFLCCNALLQRKKFSRVSYELPLSKRNTKSMVFLEAVGLIKLLTNPFSVDERRAISPGEFRSALTNAATSDGDGDREDGGKSLDDSRSAWSSVTSLRKLLPFITFIDESVTASPAVQLVMSCLDRVGAVDASEVARWKPTQLLTPRDLEDGAVPLRNGVEFGELVPIRINN